MPYDEFFADRVRHFFKDKNTSFLEKKMFGGLCFMVDDKMCCGVMHNKKLKADVLMARIGENAQINALQRDGCLAMDFTGRPMKGYVFVTAAGWDTDADLAYWLQLCLDFNPFAKASKKRKKG